MSAAQAVAIAAPLPEVVIPPLLELFGSLHCRPDIPNEVYHADRSCVSTSGIKQLLRSPAHFQAYLNGSSRKETPAMAFGTAVHARLLEPEVFAQTYVIAPNADKRTAAWKEFEIANADKRILSIEDAAAIEGISRSVSTHVEAAALLRVGLTEHTIIWQDEETGIWMKVRPDCLALDFDRGICLDVKTTEDASAAAFARACVNYDYDLQAAIYLEGLRQVFRRDFDFGFLATEKSEPFGRALYAAPAEMIERGKIRFRRALNILKDCREKNEWPSYQADGTWDILDWPRWASA